MAPFVLKFKGNKSFSPFSNLADSESLTRTWRVCTKVASHLEQGQRLENLAWRLFFIHNVMVESDNAKSKREFKKLSKSTGDKLDKDKGRSIDELQAPAFNHNASSDRIRQLAEEKERHREAHLHPGQAGAVGMKGMQYTFAIDPSVRGRATTTKGVTKPSATAPQANKARGRPSRTATLQNLIDGKSNLSDDKNSDPNVLRFPSLFSNDFGPSALLCPLPSVSSSMSYGEDVAMSSADTFGVTRPTFEFPLDELLHSVDSPSSGGAATPGPHDKQATSPVMNTSTNNTKVENGTISLRQAEGFARPHPPTFNPNDLGYPSATPPETSTQSVTKAMRQGPSATPPVRNPGMNPAHINHGNTAPGGVKSECSNCGATHTPLWRRGLNDELNCNACGLYCKLHKRPRPKTLRNSHGDGSRGSGWNAPRNGESEMVADPVQCFNCATMATPLWRKDDEGNTLCNACGLYLKLHGSKRPLSMKSDVIRKRSRHDAEKRGGPGPSNTTSGASPPSGSPSRRTSPTPNDNQQQVPAPHQTVSQSEPLIGPQLPMPFFGGDYEFNQESELMGALGGPPDLSGSMGGINNLSGSPYNGYNNYPSNPSPILGGQGFSSEPQGMMVDIPSADQHRGQKRRRLSDDSGFHSSDTSTLGGTSGLVTPPHLTTSPSSVSVNLTHSPTSPTSFNPFSFYDLAYPTLGIHPPMQVLDGSLFMHPPLVPPFSLPESMGSLGLADASPIEDGDGNRNGPNSGNDHGMMVDSGDVKSEYFLDSHYTSF